MRKQIKIKIIFEDYLLCGFCLSTNGNVSPCNCHVPILILHILNITIKLEEVIIFRLVLCALWIKEHLLFHYKLALLLLFNQMGYAINILKLRNATIQESMFRIRSNISVNLLYASKLTWFSFCDVFCIQLKAEYEFG